MNINSLVPFWMFLRRYLFFVLIACCGIIHADEIKLTSNIDHSALKFQIPFLKISEVEGRFNEFQSLIKFDQAQKKLISLEISINAESIDTGNSKRDRHLKRSDFLDINKYPEIYFQSNTILQIENHFEVKGNLKFKEQHIPISFKATFLGLEQDTWKKDNFFFEFSGETTRKDLALTWNKTIKDGGFLIGEKISFSGVVQAQPEGIKTAFSRFMIPDSNTIRQREKRARGEYVEETVDAVSEKSDSISNTAVTPITKLKRIESIESKANHVNDQILTPMSIMGVITYLVIGFYGFVGAIALAVTFQHFFKKREFKNKKIGEILKESIADTTAILIIVPYAIAMWMYLVR